MPFPALDLLLDDFERASLGSSWSPDIYGSGEIAAWSIALAVEAYAPGNESISMWHNAETFAGDAEAYMVEGSTGWPANVEDSLTLCLHVQSPGSGNADMLQIEAVGSAEAGASDVRCYEVINGARTQLGGTQSIGHGFSDAVGLDRIGNTVATYARSTGNVWDELLGVGGTASIPKAGYIGLFAYTSHPFRDNRVAEVRAAVVASPQKAYPVADAGGSWTAVGAPTTWEATDETSPSDTDYAESPLNTGTPTEEKFEIGPLVKPAAGSDLTLSVRLGKDQGGGDTLQQTVKLYGADGTTLLWTSSNFTESTAITKVLTIPSATVDGISSGDFSGGLVVGVVSVKL